jgi:hypothetical protein
LSIYINCVTANPWLVLMHQIPPNPAYLRAKVNRRLSQLGALVVKRSAYLLPANDSTLEDFQWLRQEIRDQGGDAWIVEGRFVAGLTDDEIRRNFQAARTVEYRALAADARLLLERATTRARSEGDDNVDAERRRLLRRIEATRRIDFFHADGREEVEGLMSTLDRLTTGNDTRPPVPARDALKGRTWVTRTGVKVDRMSSSWLIRRFIDPAATFAFVRADAPVEIPDAVRFDMYDGEFTHDGGRCTFEVLLDVSGHADDPGLTAMAQIVHDLDLRDDRYQRPEAAGVAALIDGLVSRFDDDNRRLAESAPLFEALYDSLKRKR